MENLTLDQVVAELQKNVQNPELIKDNKFLFEYNGAWYRVRVPNQKQFAEANVARNVAKVQMLQKGKKEGYLLKNDLIAVLKENGIDIAAMDAEIEKYKDQIIQIALTTAKKKDDQEGIIEKFEKQVDELEAKIRSVINEKMNHLAVAIEYQTEDAWYKHLVASCTEKQVSEDKWERVWASFADYQNDDTNLPYICESHFCTLIQNG